MMKPQTSGSTTTRRSFLASATALGLLPFAGARTGNASPPSSATISSTERIFTQMQKASFKNNLGINLAGNLFLPADFDATRTYPAVAVSSPATGVKEQTSGLYAAKLAERGFVALAYDPSFQGESGGEPRFREDPNVRVEDVRGAVDYLSTLSFVDANRIGVLGICAGGGYAGSAAMTELRIKAVGLVVPVNGGREFRAGGAEATIETLQAVAAQRTAEAQGAEPMVLTMMTDDMFASEDNDAWGGAEYYLTDRGRHPNWANKMRFTGMDSVIGFDAFHLADTLLTQPLQIIVGSEDGSFHSRTVTPRSVTSLTASTLNSRLNFRLVISALQFLGHDLIFVSTKPAAAQIAWFWVEYC